MSDETPASGPKRQTRGQLLRARGRASQQEVRHVDTGDEQDKRGDGQQQGQRDPSVRRETALSARPGVETDAPRSELRHHRIAHALLERHLDLVDDGAIGRVNRGARLFQRDAGLQTGEQVDPISAPVLWRAARIGRQAPAHRDRHEDVSLQPDGRSVKPRRRDADDGHGVSVDGDRLVEDVRAPAHVALPVGVTQHDDLGPVHRAIVARSQQAAERRPQTEHGKVAARHEQALALRGLVAITQIDGEVAVRGDAGEDRLEALQVPEHGIAEHRRAFTHAAAGRRSGPRPGRHEIHQPARLGNRQGLEEQLVEQGEHRRVGADAERERQHGHRGEAWRTSQHAQCVTDVVPPVGEELHAHHAPPPPLVDRHTFEARALDIAEAAQGQLARARRRFAALDQFADPHVQVEGQFGRHVTARIEPEQPTETPPPCRHVNLRRSRAVRPMRQRRPPRSGASSLSPRSTACVPAW